MFHLDKLKYRVTCGWPVTGGLARNRRVGECHSDKSSAGGVFEIFVSPTLAEPLEAAGIKAAHGKGFVKVCQHVGLVKGKPKSVMPGDRLNERLAIIISGLPAYPHQALTGTPKEKSAKGPTSLKLVCKECGCELRISFRWLEEAGPPVCGCGGELGVDGGE